MGNLNDAGSSVARRRLQDMVSAERKRQGSSIPVFVGIQDRSILNAIGGDFLYIDHSYFNRGWHKEMFRLVRGWVHLTHEFDRPDDRLKKFGVEIEPWRKRGRDVVLIPPTQPQHIFGVEHWADETTKKLRALTDRPVICKAKKDGLREALSDAWAVVTWSSAAGVEAALMGVPVFSTKECPSWPVNAGPLESIERPEYKDRHTWAAALSYASWHKNEICSIGLKDYAYAYRYNV